MKGHSERVPGKNLRPFAGNPLYHAVIKTLLASSNIDRVIINTDSPKIAADARANFDRVEIIERPPELQGDLVPMNEIIAYDLEKSGGTHFLQTHSTNPLLKTETIDLAIEQYFASPAGHDTLFAVTRLQTRLYRHDGTPLNHDPKLLLRTQDLKPIYEENSNFYLFSRDSFFENERRRIGKRSALFEMDKLEAIDIDTEEDFILAELLYKKFR